VELAVDESSALFLAVVDPLELGKVAGAWLDEFPVRLRLASPPAGELASERKNAPPPGPSGEETVASGAGVLGDTGNAA
jgi:hypothetical protein